MGPEEGDGSDGSDQEGPVDPLRFVSAGVSYRDKVRQAQRKTKLQEAVLCGEARLGGCPWELAVMDFHFLGGSMGTVVGERLVPPSTAP